MRTPATFWLRPFHVGFGPGQTPARRVHAGPGEVASPRKRLQWIAASTRTALESHPAEARDIVVRAELLLDALDADVRNGGSDKELLFDIEVTRVELIKLANVGPSEEPVAPWEAFPYEPGSMGWRMGPGEDVYFAWAQFWASLNEADQERYLRDHPAPPEWAEYAADRGRWAGGHWGRR